MHSISLHSACHFSIIDANTLIIRRLLLFYKSVQQKIPPEFPPSGFLFPTLGFTYKPVLIASFCKSTFVKGSFFYSEKLKATNRLFTTKKKQIDPTGGTTYSIASISVLLSVPCALHAKTAESITGSGNGSLGHYVGEFFGGGVVCWVDHTGQHGRILSMDDLTTTGHIWCNGTPTLGITNYWDGAANTTAILNQSGHTTSAAGLCANYTNADYGTGIYSDWYLPAIAELKNVFDNIFEIQKPLFLDGNPATTPLFDPGLPEFTDEDPDDNFLPSYYWSSSMLNIKLNDGGEYYVAYTIYFDAFGEEDRGISMGMIVPNNPEYNKLLNVRAMRAF